MSTTRSRAVVLGGSIAGLFAARVLADEFESVVIVERDRLPVAYDHRRGVPQAHHVHGLLPRGRHAAEELFPGLTDDLVDAGGIPGDILANVGWIMNGRHLRKAQSDLIAVSASRPLIEGSIRRRVLALPNVEVLDGYDIVGLSSTVDGQRVTGARITSLYGEGSRVLTADLVLDCTGRGSRTPRWLNELGFLAPTEDVVGIDLTYASRMFEAPADVFGGDVVVSTARTPVQRRGAVMQRLEGGRMLVTLAGVVGERPPLELGAFTEYARSLPTSDTYDAIRAGRPIDDGTPYRVPTYMRRRYEQLTALPAGLLAGGDAVCNFNPVYGQGMSVAAATMMVLREELTHPGDPDPRRYYKAVSALLDAPWGIGVGADLATPGVTGPAMPPSPLTPEYIRGIQLGGAEDPELAKAFIRVMALIDPPPALLRPEIAERAARVGQPVG